MSWGQWFRITNFGCRMLIDIAMPERYYMDRNFEFAKLSGSGNDFVCISNLEGQFDELLVDSRLVGHFAQTLCRRGLWIGADGIIFATQPQVQDNAHFSARFFEADGSEAELCGNGTACFVRWVIDSGMSPGGEIRILTPAGIVIGKDVEDGFYRVCIPLPRDIETNIDLKIDGHLARCDFAITGVPHAVVFVDDLQALDIDQAGPAIRFHQRFAPRGANANFVQVLGEGRLAIRTWEFGVEGETLACGTGSAAAAVLAARRFNWPKRFLTNDQPILVEARSGDILRIFVGIDNDKITDLCLDTKVRPAFTGTASQELIQEALTPPAATLHGVAITGANE